MKDSIKWEDNFLLIDDCYQLINYIGDSKFQQSDIQNYWYTKFSIPFKNGLNTLSLLHLLNVVVSNGRYYSLNPDIKFKDLIEFQDALTNQLFEYAKRYIIDSIPFDRISFNTTNQGYYFARNAVALSWSGLINFLTNLNILNVFDKNYLIIKSPRLEDLIINHRIKASRNIKAITPDSLRILLEKQNTIGFVSEKYAMQYEKERLRNLNIENLPKQISLLDVTQGFDILSFQSLQSQDYDRFIEVKTFNNFYFYMSNNEYQTAKSLGDKYYLYLVKHLDNDQKFVIEEVCNPYLKLQNKNDWSIQATDFKITSRRI